MERSRPDNYATQAAQARQYFLTYDQPRLIAKWGLAHDEAYLYFSLFGRPYRLCRTSGAFQRKTETGWLDGSFGEVMTGLDILCDGDPDTPLTGNWKLMQNFGLLFHRNLLEPEKDSFALSIQQDPEGFRRACVAVGGEIVSGGDISYAIAVMGQLKIAVQFWFADEDFPPQVRFFWDENALHYIRYETMHFAVGFLKQLLMELRK